MHKLYLEKYEPEVFRAMQNDEKIPQLVTYEYFCRHLSPNITIRLASLDRIHVKHVTA